MRILVACGLTTLMACGPAPPPAQPGNEQAAPEGSAVAPSDPPSGDDEALIVVVGLREDEGRIRLVTESPNPDWRHINAHLDEPAPSSSSTSRSRRFPP